MGEGRQGQTRLPRETSSNSSPSRMEIPEGRVRSNRWARRGGGESCVVIRGKRARARGCVYVRSRADTDNLLLHLLPDLKSVARSPVFTVSPFFARPPYVSRQFVIAPSEKMAKRTTFRFPLNYPPSESSARVEGGGSKGGFFLLIRCASRLPRGCPDRFLCVESSSRKGCWVYERWLIAPFTLPRDFMAERRTIEKSVETERSA